jgi:hypothetical protein
LTWRRSSGRLAWCCAAGKRWRGPSSWRTRPRRLRSTLARSPISWTDTYEKEGERQKLRTTRMESVKPSYTQKIKEVNLYFPLVSWFTIDKDFQVPIPTSQKLRVK